MRPFRAKSPPPTQIAIVGPCASGKSSLAQSLQALGWSARQIAQEHSYVPDMWLRLTRPRFLIFLQASFETCTARKQLGWVPADYEDQLVRLRHARENCDLLIETDTRTQEEILSEAVRALAEANVPAEV